MAGEYSSLPKLKRIKLPSGTTYAIVDADGRSMVAATFAKASASIGDYIIYQDSLWRCTTPVTAGADWDGSKWEPVTVTSELKSIKTAISGGIHYRGYTTTSLYEGSSENPIVINNASFTCESGDMVIETPPDYEIGVAYLAGEYVVGPDSVTYQVVDSITAADNTGFAALNTRVVANKPEFIFDGSVWNELGAANPKGFGKLAYKDSAQGTYTRPTGSGSVNINTYTPTKASLSTTSIKPTGGTTSASEVSVKTSKTFAIRNAEATTVAVRDSTATLVGNADVDTAVAVGTSLSGTTTFVTTALKTASLGGTQTFNTDAIKSAVLTGTDGTTAAKEGIVADVDGDLLELEYAGTTSLSNTTSAATTATVTLSTTNTGSSDEGTVTLSTTNITPAKAVTNASTSVWGASSTTDIYGTSGTDTAISELNITPRTVALEGSATTVATGSLDNSGNQLVTGLTVGQTSATVTVGTESASVVVE